MNSRILIPLDGSELAECALPWALYLAEIKGLEVELMRCFESPEKVFLVTDFLKSDSDKEPTEIIREQAVAYLEKKAAETESPTTVSARQGDPASLILERAAQADVDTMVMATHGRGGLGRWLLGSVATKVARGVGSTPVLFVKAAEKRRTPKLDRILVPLDGSPTAEAAIPHAVALAEKAGATVLLYQSITFAPLGHPNLDASSRIEAAEAHKYLSSFKSRYPDARFEIDAQITGLGSGIVAQGESCDLTVMSSHGRTGVARWLLGSVAEKVLQTTTRPVLLVHPG